MKSCATVQQKTTIVLRCFFHKVFVLAFVIQMDGVTEVRPNIATHPEFGEAMNEAKAAGVEILFLMCHVEPDRLEIAAAD